ncbi:copper chaperone PCu(A)C [Streptomyces glomeratus]|uniref:copper chaperone PCu(A)C n=1 Tax=Streptomyces glomeratus TaxID=284452 RepID=UPI001F429CA1|nr:copper chaperone PCu(A)C [Streptomyces glomeratus]MCF1511265.1 copper chaperone PCu(A)C [Streptomyces glomeratus]
MSSSLRRGALAAAAIAFSIASLAACGAGNDSQTLEIKPDNAATSLGDIKVQNALVITQPDPKATGPAVISATVFNAGNTDQTLDSISVDGDGTASLSPAKGKGKVTVPAHGSVVIGGKNQVSAVLDNPGAAVQNGNAQKITFSFSKTGDVSLRAFVVPAESYFSKWGPSNIPTPSASPAQSTSPKPSKSASGSPAAGSSGTPDKASSKATATESASAGH